MDAQYALSSQSQHFYLSQFFGRVYGWMGAGLALTAIVAGFAYASGITDIIASNAFVFYGLIILQLVEVMVFASLARRASVTLARTLFLVYAVTVGLSFSIFFAAYEIRSIAATFVTAAAMFGALAVWGTVTKRNLDGVGAVATMALIGLIVGGLINIFLGNSLADYVLNVVGVIIFSALTAYDAQKIQSMYEGGAGDESKEAIFGALTLYLDFINLFIRLLGLFGKRRD